MSTPKTFTDKQAAELLAKFPVIRSTQPIYFAHPKQAKQARKILGNRFKVVTTKKI